MIQVDYATFSKCLDEYCSKVADTQGTILVRCEGDKRIVILSQPQWEALRKSSKNAQYLADLDRSFAQLRSGRGIAHELIEEDQ